MLKFVALVALLAVNNSAGPVPQEKSSRFPLFSNSLNTRIINGTDTTIEENPHQISIQLKDYGHWCGGSIISKNWVLTAAHCVADKTADVIVLAGTANQFEGGTLHRISEIIIHENFAVTSFGRTINDIALIRVKESFVFDATRNVISLFAKDEETKVGSIAVVTGWGETGDGFPDILNRVELPIITKTRCNELYENIGGIAKGQICAAYEKGGKDACQGDSGGPMSVNGRLAGIVSWGIECAVAGQPGVYTEVAYYRDWINEYSRV